MRCFWKRAHFWVGIAVAGYGHAAHLTSVEVEADGVPTSERDLGCIDEHERCAEWAALGECAQNPSYMMASCVESCNVCPAEVIFTVNICRWK